MIELDQIRAEISGCTRCPLAGGRIKTVPGEGPADAEILLIGEGPGFNEDKQGRPFVGQAGHLLEELLASIGLTRRDVFITNVVKCFISPRVLIYTADGYKPIKDIKVGDLVLTHRGRFRQVTYIRPRENLPKGSDVIRLTVQGDQGEPGNRRPVRITVTPEHPFLVNGEWKAADQIQPGDTLRMLGDRCEVCGRTFFVRYDRYERRQYRTCSYRCHNRRIFHSEEARDKARQAMAQQYATGARDRFAITARANARVRELVAAGEAKIQQLTSEERRRGRLLIAQHINEDKTKHRIGYGEFELVAVLDHAGEFTFVDLKVVGAEHRPTRRDFPLYNIGVAEDESYIAAGMVSHNCRPPGNRDPMPGEIAACGDYLDRQIAAIGPKVIATLGRHSLAKFLPGKTISRIHGQPSRWRDCWVLPLYHPAAALHQQALQPTLFEDFRTLPELLEPARQQAAAAPAPTSAPAAAGDGPAPAKQLSMF